MKTKITTLILTLISTFSYGQWIDPGNDGTGDIYYNNGNVGIGTISPTRKLDVGGTVKIETGTVFDFTNDRLRIDGGTGVGTTGLLEIRQSGVTHNDGIAISSSHPHAHRIWKHSDGSLNFGTGGNRHAVFTTSGNVGIGTASPSYNLDVAGSFGAAGSRFTVAQGVINQKSTIENWGSGSNTGGIAVNYDGRSSSNGTSQAYFRDFTIYNGKGAAIGFFDGSSENVGIGTTSPTQKLEVNGTIRAKEIKVEASPWPDYVFADDYKLSTLEQTATYIKENHHLPEIPPAKEMEANGVNLGEMNMLLLKKIEELTLHLIEKDQQLEEVLERLEVLESK